MARPPGPTLFDLLKLPKKTEADMVLEIPRKLGARFGEVIYHKFSKQYILTGAKGIEQVLKTNAANYTKQNFFHKRLIPLFGFSVLVSDGDYWKHRRKISSGAFQHAMIKSYAPSIISLTEQWISHLIASAPPTINLVTEFNNLTVKIALKAFCSEDFSEKIIEQVGDAVYFGNWYTTRAIFVSPWKPTLNNFRFYFKMRKMNKLLLELIRKRRALPSPPPDDLLQRLISAEIPESGPLTDLEVLAELKTLIITGYETNALTLTWMFYLLSIHTEYRDRLEQEIDLSLEGKQVSFESLSQLPFLKAVIFETMRLYPPIWGITRRSIEDDHILGYKIPAKSLISMNLYALHRNPEYWKDPDTFNPDRFLDETQNRQRHPYAFVPFSTGPRICIASNFAMAEAMLVAVTIMQKLRFLRNDEALRRQTKNKTRNLSSKIKTKEDNVIIEPCFSLRPLGGLCLKPVLR